MNWGAFLLLSVIITVALLFIQRSEAKRRRLTAILMVGIGILAFYWANTRGLTREFILGVIAGLVVNLLFWMLIGRYNPVKDSDDVIHVIGMDD